MIIGQVQHISVEEAYAQGYELRYGKDGFMLLVPAPQDLVPGERISRRLLPCILKNTTDLRREQK